MARVQLSIEESEFVAARIREFENETTESHRKWLIPYVLQFQALPIISDWFETIGIQADGTVIAWSNDEEYAGFRALEVTAYLRATLADGAKLYPRLKSLIPTRPVNAQTCENCGGIGSYAAFRHIKCGVCGGLGWVECPNPA